MRLFRRRERLTPEQKLVKLYREHPERFVRFDSALRPATMAEFNRFARQYGKLRPPKD